MVDSYGRHLHYLRVSLTDACNLRCVYCMPEDIRFRPHAHLMQDDEILTLVRVAREPGRRQDPPDRRRADGAPRGGRVGPGDQARSRASSALAMTTNGVQLAELAQPLAEAGLDQVNISIDSLDPEKFRRITRARRSGRRLGGHRGRGGGRADADQDQLRGDTRFQRRRGRGPGPAHAGQAVGSALHRADAVRQRRGFPAEQVVSSAETRATIEAALGPLDAGARP